LAELAARHGGLWPVPADEWRAFDSALKDWLIEYRDRHLTKEGFADARLKR
jgi:hypothetical protein